MLDRRERTRDSSTHKCTHAGKAADERKGVTTATLRWTHRAAHPTTRRNTHRSDSDSDGDDVEATGAGGRAIIRANNSRAHGDSAVVRTGEHDGVDGWLRRVSTRRR